MTSSKPPTPYKVLADELDRRRHRYRCWPPNLIGNPCDDCGALPGNRVHWTKEVLLFEAGLRVSEETFDEMRGYWNPAEAGAMWEERVRKKLAAREAAIDHREEGGATSWTKNRAK